MSTSAIDTQTAEESPFQIGDRVLIKNPPQKSKKRKMFTPIYEGNPAVITSIDKTIAEISPEDGSDSFKIKLSSLLDQFLQQEQKSAKRPPTLTQGEQKNQK